MGVQKYSAETREQCIKLRNDGLTFVEIAARLNIPYWKSVARIFYTNGETSGRLMSDDEKQTIVNLYKSGYSVQEISAETRRSATGIRKHLIESGLIIICGKSQRESRYDEMREYKAQGHTMAEVAEHFCVNRGTASKICKGIAPQKTDYTKVSNTLRNRVRPETHKKTEERLKDLLPDCFEYCGGYDGHDCYVTIRCKQCGTEFERSAQAIRKKQVKYCPCCRKQQTERNAEQRQLEREEQKALRDAERERKRQEAEQRRIENTVIKVCRMCGIEFETTNSQRVFCSSECSHLWQNRRSYNRIPKDKRVDKGINALSLFKRDNGVCWICGGKCDLNDYTTRNGVFIAGDWYPSVDHVKPICEGGEDAWENVKLAHRICNSRRFYAEKHSPRSKNA